MDKKILEKADKSLRGRVKNEYDGTFSYMQNRRVAVEDLSRDDCNGRAVLMLHDFFDACHIYEWKIFVDFREWAEFTIETCLRNNIPLAVKPHPSQIIQSEHEVNRLRKEYENKGDIIWLSKKQRNSAVFESNPQLVVTMYGSVAAEATYAGISVLLAGDHPGCNFRLGEMALNKWDYQQKLIKYREAIPGSKLDAILFAAQHYEYVFKGEKDSLKSHFNQKAEEDWNSMETYEDQNIIDYSDKIARNLIEEIRKKMN